MAKDIHFDELRMLLMQDGVLEGLQLEISERPTTKQLEDLRKQVKILQVTILIKK